MPTPIREQILTELTTRPTGLTTAAPLRNEAYTDEPALLIKSWSRERGSCEYSAAGDSKPEIPALA